MSKLSEEYLKILKDIEKKISNEEEKQYVLNKFSELSALYMDIIDRVTVNTSRVEELEERQDGVIESLIGIKETVDLIKKDIYEDDEYDFEIVCPYCNHEFIADVESELKEEIECPECHNLIQLDWNCEDEECGGCCSSCNHDDCAKEEDKDIEDNEDDM